MITLRFITSRLRLLLALLPLLTVKKVLNLAAAGWYFLFRSSRSVRHPPVLILSLTSGCNFSCVMCLKSSRPDTDKGALIDYRNPRQMEFTTLEKLLRRHAGYLCMVRLHGGEPLTYDAIDRLIDLLAELKIPYTIVTNGSLLQGSLLDKLVGSYCIGISVSIDAATPRTYSRLRVGGDLDRLLANVDRLNRLKSERRTSRPVLNASMCTFSINAGEMPELVRLCKRHGISTLTVGEGWDYDTPHIGPEHLVANNRELVRRAVAEARREARASRILLRTRFPALRDHERGAVPRQNGILPPTNCFNLYASLWLLPDFLAVGCSNATSGFGRVEADTLQQVWIGDGMGYARARTDLRQGQVPEPCKGCIYTGGFYS